MNGSSFSRGHRGSNRPQTHTHTQPIFPQFHLRYRRCGLCTQTSTFDYIVRDHVLFGLMLLFVLHYLNIYMYVSVLLSCNEEERIMGSGGTFVMQLYSTFH